MAMDRLRVRPGAILILASALFLGACAAQSDVSGDDSPTVNDPLEPYNRYMFAVNDALDGGVIRPAAEAYRFVIPQPGRRAILNFLRNLESPVTLANDVLQGEVGRAGVTSARFIINTTVGVAGLFDAAGAMGFERHSEDFGQTLGVYGAGGGPYFVLPIFGPSNFRDTFGMGVDVFFDPVRLWARNTDREGVALVRTLVRGIDLRSRTIETLDEIERTSIDYYATIRSLYRQTREDEIRNGDLAPLPELGAD